MCAHWNTYKSGALNTSNSFQERTETFPQIKQVHCLKHSGIGVLFNSYSNWLITTETDMMQRVETGDSEKNILITFDM